MKKVPTIFIIHFHPLELYPPVMNLINFFHENLDERIIIISNKKQSGSLREFTISSPGIKFIRTGIKGYGAFFRWVNYFLFYFKSFFLLLKIRPRSILYFETLSSAPALVYKKIFGKKVKLFVHYHEYTTLEEYDKNMRLSKWMHKMEGHMYSKYFNWISHTNEVRMQKFKTDHNLHNSSNINLRLLPNYPPKSWINGEPKKLSGQKNIYKLVYVGAVSCKTMYLREVIKWVGDRTGLFSLDIYSHNMDREAEDFISNNGHENIKFKGSCDYYLLSNTLSIYDVGLVIYKPYSENMIYNAPNKVFEYLACGLDVWFSKDMTYSIFLTRENVYPKILPVDFSNLDEFDFKTALNRDGLKYEPSVYYYESTYGEISQKIVEGFHV